MYVFYLSFQFSWYYILYLSYLLFFKFFSFHDYAYTCLLYTSDAADD